MEKLKAGAAKAVITPPREWLPVEIMPGEPQVTGILQDIYTRAIVLDNGVTRFLFLNLDCGPSADIQMKRELSEKFNIPVENMMICWTHNHSALMKWTREPQNDAEAYFSQIVFQGIDTAVTEAIAALRPARWGFAEGKSYINVNRDKLGEDGHWLQTPNFEGPSDKALATMKFVDEQGSLIAVVVNYACHAIMGYMGIDFDGGVKINGGFPGYMSDFLERRYPGSVALWNSGAAGDQNPSFGLMKFNLDGSAEEIMPPPGAQYMLQKYLGELQAIDVIHAMDSLKDSDLRDHMKITSSVRYVTMPGQHPPEGIDHMTAFLSVYPDFRRDHPEILVNGKSLAEIDRIEMVAEGTSTMQMQLNLLGDTAWVGASGELYADIGFELKAASLFRKTVVVTHTEGDALYNGGYILSDAAADHDTFQYYHTQTRPGGNDKRIVDTMLMMFDDTLNGGKE